MPSSAKNRDHADDAADGFLIGGLIGAPYEALASRVYARLGEEGFGDLRRAQAEVFRYVPPDGGRVTDIAEAAGVSKQAMAYTIESLIEMGYLSREVDPADRRAHIVRRTERGWEVNRAARRAVLEVQAEWTAALGPEQMEQLLRLLGDLSKHLGVEYLGSISEVSTRS